MDKVLIIVTIILAVLLVVAAVWGQNTRDDLTVTQETLDETQQELADAKLETADAANRLEEISGKLADTQAKLADTQNELAETKEKLENTSIALSELKSSSDDISVTGQQTEILRPTGPGSETSIDTQWPASGARWDKICEAIADEDHTYIENKNGEVYTFQRDLFTIQNHKNGQGTIDKVIIVTRTKFNSPAKSCLFICFNTHGEVYDIDMTTYGRSEWTNISHEMTVNPFTESAWTWEEIDAMEAGVSLGGSMNSPDWSRCTQLYVEVYYH